MKSLKIDAFGYGDRYGMANGDSHTYSDGDGWGLSGGTADGDGYGRGDGHSDEYGDGCGSGTEDRFDHYPSDW